MAPSREEFPPNLYAQLPSEPVATSIQDGSTSKDMGAPPDAPLTRYLGYILLVDLTAVCFGYTLAFTGGTIGDITGDLGFCGDDWSMDDGAKPCFKEEMVAALAAGASVFGCIVAGPTTENFGRKPVILSSFFLFILGYVAVGLAPDLTVVLVGRATTGFAAGVAGVVTPMYVAEVSPAHLRGQLGSLFNLGISGGVLLVDLLNACGIGWRVLAWLVGTIVPFIGFVAMLRFPESPVFLAAAAASVVDEQEKCNAYKEKLVDAMQWLHGGSIPKQLEADLVVDKLLAQKADQLLGENETPGNGSRESKEETNGGVMTSDFEAQTSISRSSVVGSERASVMNPVNASMFGKRNWYATMIGVGVPVGFALGGVNSVNAYCATIMGLSGITWIPWAITSYGAVQWVVGIVGIVGLVEQFDRKTLLAVSAAGCACSHSLIAFGVSGVDIPGIHILALVGALCFVTFVAIGLGPLSWAYSSEVLPSAVRGPAMSLASVLFWTATFLQELFLLDMMDAFTPTGTFLFFAAFNVGTLVFVLTCLVETRGRTLEEIEALVTRQ